MADVSFRRDYRTIDQADDLRIGFEVLERGAFGHARALPGALPRTKESSFDKTLQHTMRPYSAGNRFSSMARAGKAVS